MIKPIGYTVYCNCGEFLGKFDTYPVPLPVPKDDCRRILVYQKVALDFIPVEFRVTGEDAHGATDHSPSNGEQAGHGNDPQDHPKHD